MTINNTEEVALKVIDYLGFDPMQEKQFGEILRTGGLANLEGLEEVAQQVREQLGPNDPETSSLVNDRRSCFCAIFEMLDRVVQDVMKILELSVEHM